MLELTFEQINTRLDEVPQKLKDAIFSDKIDAVIIRLCQAYHLDDKKTSAVGRNIGEILFGFESYKNLASDLQTDLNIDNRLATAIANDIVSKILSPYRKELETAYHPITSTSAPQPQEVKPSPLTVDLRPFDILKDQKLEEKPKPPTPPTPVEGPAILFKSETITSATPITTEKRRPTLGGLFGFSRRKETAPKEKIIAEIETPSQKPIAKPTIAKTEIPAFKVVHYSQFEPQKPADQKDAGPKMFVGQSPVTPTPPQPFKPKIISVTPIPTEKSKMFVEQKPTAPTPPQPFKPKIISVTPIPPSPRIYPKAKGPSVLPIVPKAPVIPMELPKPPQQLPPAIPAPKSPEPTIATTVEEEEMVDLINLQKVKIKTEVEKLQPGTNNGNIVNLKH